MHRKLCVHAQFSVLMVRLLKIKLKSINRALQAKLKIRHQNEIDMAFEDNYNSINLN
jgi:hypothetical protein